MDRTLMVFLSAIAFSVCDSLVLKDKSLFWEDKMPGDNFSFNCSISSAMGGVDVLKGNQHGNEVIMHKSTQYASQTEGLQYKNRINSSGPLNKMSVTITQLTEEDSGTYWCQYSVLTEDGDVIKTDSREIITILVKAPKQCPTQISPDSTMPVSSAVVCANDSGPSVIMVSFSIVTAVVVFIMFSMMIIFHIIPKIKKLSSAQSAAQSRPNDSVYEVMSATLRRT